MATDGPDPPPCDPKLFKEGIGINCGGTAGANAFEELVQEIAAITQCPVDWHYMGGRAIVRCFEKDNAKVEAEIEKTLRPKLRKQLEEAYPDLYAPINSQD